MIYNTTECHCIISNLLDVAANGLVAVDVDNLDTEGEEAWGIYWRELWRVEKSCSKIPSSNPSDSTQLLTKNPSFLIHLRGFGLIWGS